MLFKQGCFSSPTMWNLQPSPNSLCVWRATGVWSDLDSTDWAVRMRERKKEGETDILMTSSVFCAPATRREITVITADQHVHFLEIDALQSAENCTCARNEMTLLCLLANPPPPLFKNKWINKKKERTHFHDRRLPDPDRLLNVILIATLFEQLENPHHYPSSSSGILLMAHKHRNGKQLP